MAIARIAHADVDPAKLQAASDAFNEGTKAFKRKDYDEAAQHFEEADRHAPSSAAIINAIYARKAAKQLARAATLTALALKRYPNNAEIKELSKTLLAPLEKQLGRIDTTCSPACTLALDGRLASATEVTSFVLYVDPGPHTLVAGWSQDRSESRHVDAKRGEPVSVKFEAPAPPKNAEAEPSVPAMAMAPRRDEPSLTPTSTSKKPLPPWVTYAGVTTTAVLLGVSIWSGIDTKQNPGPERVREECAGKTTSCPAFAAGKAKEARTNILFVTTGVVGVATGIAAVLLTDWTSSSKNEARLGVVPSVAPLPRGARVGVGASF